MALVSAGERYSLERQLNAIRRSERDFWLLRRGCHDRVPGLGLSSEVAHEIQSMADAEGKTGPLLAQELIQEALAARKRKPTPRLQDLREGFRRLGMGGRGRF